MWKRDDSVKPAAPVAPTPSVAPPAPVPAAVQARVEPRDQASRDQWHTGTSIIIKGELSGSEDLTINGQVEGRIDLHDHVLTIGPSGRIKAAVAAKLLIVMGEIVGNIVASEKVEIRDNGSVEGDITSPRVAIAEGAHFRGSVDMQRVTTKPAAPAVPGDKPAATPAAHATPAAAQAPQGAPSQNRKLGI